jgi:hypothetical protein
MEADRSVVEVLALATAPVLTVSAREPVTSAAAIRVDHRISLFM